MAITYKSLCKNFYEQNNFLPLSDIQFKRKQSSIQLFNGDF